MGHSSCCIICYRKYNDDENSSENPNHHDKLLSEDEKELLKRFFKLLERYFEGGGIPTADSSLIDKLIIEGIIGACEDCLKIAESFCNLFHQMKIIELNLNWEISKLKNILFCANLVPSRLQTLKEVVGQAETSDNPATAPAPANQPMGSYLNLIVKFKRNLITNCFQKLMRSNPKLILTRIKEADFKSYQQRLDEISATASKKVFGCDLCEKSFKYRKILSNHKKIVHEGYQYSCGYCSSQFLNRKEVKLHISEIHVLPNGTPLPVKIELRNSNGKEERISHDDSALNEKENENESNKEIGKLAPQTTSGVSNNKQCSEQEQREVSKNNLNLLQIIEKTITSALRNETLPQPLPDSMAIPPSRTTPITTEAQISDSTSGPEIEILEVVTKTNLEVSAAITEEQNDSAEPEITPPATISKSFQCKNKNCQKSFNHEQSAWKHNRIKHEGYRYHCGYCDRTFTERKAAKRHLNLKHVLPSGIPLAVIINFKKMKNDNNKGSTGAMSVDAEVEKRHEDKHKQFKRKKRIVCATTVQIPCIDVQPEPEFPPNTVNISPDNDEAIFNEGPSLTAAATVDPLEELPIQYNSAEEVLRDLIGEVDGRDNVPEVHAPTGILQPLERLSKRYQCKNCEKSFSCESSLWQHNKIIHEKYRYHCGYCPMKFRERRYARTHSNRNHLTSSGIPLPLKIKLSISNEISETSKEIREVPILANLPLNCLPRHHHHHHHQPPQQKERSNAVNGQNIEENVSITGSSLLHCTICGKQFQRKSSLTQHKRIEHEGIRFKCFYCESHFKKRWTARNHIKRYHRSPSGDLPLPFRVEIVKIVQNENIITDNCRNQLPLPPPTTDQNGTFSISENIEPEEEQSFQIVNDNDTEFKVRNDLFDIGEVKVFSTPVISLGSLSRLKNIGGNGSNKVTVPPTATKYFCGICKQKFRTTIELFRHRKLSHDGRKAMCGICGKLFKEHANLVYHLKHRSCQKNRGGKKQNRKKAENEVAVGKKSQLYLPTSVPPQQLEPEVTTFILPIKEKSVLLENKDGSASASAASSSFINCNICGKKCQSQLSLKRHISFKHLSDSCKPHQCQFCHKRFMNSTGLRIHVDSVHLGKKYKCPHCETLFAYSWDIPKHIARSCKKT